MRTVRLINDTWNNKSEWFKNVLSVGDPIPILNEVYTVSAYLYDENNKLSGYQLEEFDYTPYNSAGLFSITHFETVSDEYVPNMVLDLCNIQFLAEKQKLWLTIDEEQLKYLNYTKKD